MTQPFYSIIIPVYNTQKYLKKSIDSVINQNFNDMEIIIINDASTDESINILKSYLNQGDKVKLIDLTQNGGVSNARNIGIQESRGKYILFLDSDDYIKPNTLQTCYNIIKNSTNIDALSFGVECQNNKTIKKFKKKYYKNQSLIKYVLNGHLYLITNTIFKSNLIKKNKVFFPKKVHYEDHFFLLKIFHHINSFMTIPNILYIYTQRKNSASHSFSIPHLRGMFKLIDFTKTNLKKYNSFEKEKKNYTLFQRILYFSFMSRVKNFKDYDALFKEILAWKKKDNDLANMLIKYFLLNQNPNKIVFLLQKLMIKTINFFERKDSL